MINEPTVLILGAGASVDFGFPLGWSLKRAICLQLSDGREIPALTQSGHTPEEQSAFAATLQASGAPSIDAFLADREDLGTIGKRAIAATLIPFENAQAVHAPREAPLWLDILFDRMRAPLKDWHRNQLSIVTFNYDRLVEQYFHTALMNRFGMPPDEAISMVRVTPIVHVHGILDEFTYANGPPGRPFSSHSNGSIVREAAEKIRIVHEGGEHDDVFVKARQLLAAAERIVVLGFGYDPTNMSRVGLNADLVGKWVIGSAIKLKQHECTLAKNRAQCGLRLEASEDLADFLRSHRSVAN